MQELFDLSQKTIIITGASGGIGLSLAKAVASFGARTILVARRQEPLKQAVQELKQLSSAVQSYLLDTNDLLAMQDFFAQHKADVLINSVGCNAPKSLLDYDEATYNQIMDANMKSAFFQTQYFVQHNPKNTSIIHVSSQMAHVGGFERSVYCASKHALEGFIKAACIELGEYNIRINTIAPTFIETKLTASTLSDPIKKQKVLDKIVLNRLGQVNDLAGAAIFLASDASSLITGTSLKVDGGWSAH